MYNITGLVANSNYTISVWTVVDGNVQSTAVSRNITTSEFNQNILLIFTSLYIWDLNIIGLIFFKFIPGMLVHLGYDGLLIVLHR